MRRLHAIRKGKKQNNTTWLARHRGPDRSTGARRHRVLLSSSDDVHARGRHDEGQWSMQSQGKHAYGSCCTRASPWMRRVGAQERYAQEGRRAGDSRHCCIDSDVLSGKRLNCNSVVWLHDVEADCTERREEVLLVINTQRPSLPSERNEERIIATCNTIDVVMDALIARLREVDGQPCGSRHGSNGRDKFPQFSPQDAQEAADELLALTSIYGDESVAPFLAQHGRLQSSIGDEAQEQGDQSRLALETVEQWDSSQPVQISITLSLDVGQHSPREQDVDKGSAVQARISALLPVSYPNCKEKPRLQLLSRFIGPHGVDCALCEEINRIFVSQEAASGMDSHASHSADHIVFIPGQVVLFDGIDKARELVEQWYSEREAQQLQRKEEQERERERGPQHQLPEAKSRDSSQSDGLSDAQRELENARISDVQSHGRTKSGIHCVSAPALTERKSTFVGHAAYIEHPEEVAKVLAHLVGSDRRIARATHPTMHAWICRTADGIVHRNCDDDGETAAGSRLAHLLDLLHLDNVLVVVTRWYGGMQLGPDRFKLINRAAREALEMLGAVDGSSNAKKSQQRPLKGAKG